MAELQLALIPPERDPSLATVCEAIWLIDQELTALRRLGAIPPSGDKQKRVQHLNQRRVLETVALRVHIPPRQRAIIGPPEGERWEAWHDHGIVHVKPYRGEEWDIPGERLEDYLG